MKRILPFSTTLFVVGAGLSLLPFSATYAVPRTDGTMTLAQSRLVDTETAYIATSVREATYYFTLEVPATASQPLQQVIFTQIEGVETIRFDEKDSRAFEGTSDRKGQNLPVRLAPSDRQKDTLTVTFDRPVQPGKTVTIALRALRNPDYEGVYLFNLTGFPSTGQTNGQSIGVGRLQFYRD
ncbi:MAG: DUF2808 domain-containing protein [Oscillatoriaceae cyanobacterium Prado104]|nr:DUF2808 domain-containing protein [Oscillatoriaceae cyanobacterium Prado104]